MNRPIMPAVRAMASMIALFVLVGLAGCADNRSTQAGGCRDSESGDQLELANSGLTCDEALAIYYLLPSGSSRRVQEIRGSGSVWQCRGVPGSTSGVRFRCEMGKRQFVVRESS